jgi:hypothetical protein
VPGWWHWEGTREEVDNFFSRLDVTGNGGWNLAEVTSGGIPISEISPRTMVCMGCGWRIKGWKQRGRTRHGGEGDREGENRGRRQGGVGREGMQGVLNFVRKAKSVQDYFWQEKFWICLEKLVVLIFIGHGSRGVWQEKMPPKQNKIYMIDFS